MIIQDSNKEENTQLKRVPVEEILEAQQIEIEEKQKKEKLKLKALQERGYSFHLESVQDDY